MSEKSDSERELPTSRIGRFARMAALGARTGASMVFSRDGDAVAKHAAEVLGTMRGLAAKVGQMASYVDGMVPEGQQAAFERALSTLRSAAPHSSPEAVAKILHEEFGQDASELFAEFDPIPFASASIGQVHRATLHDGRAVAVKVQHPGIDRAMANDLDNGAMFESLVNRFKGRKLSSKQVFQEIRKRFEEELDYEREAEHQRFFANAFADHPWVVVPGVIDERSTRRVLTSDFVEGKPLESVMDAPEALRLQWAKTLWLFAFGSILQHGRFNADPHPGNFLFQDDGKVACLDYGCIQPLGDSLSDARRMHVAAGKRETEAFEEAAGSMMKLKAGRYREAVLRYVRLCFEPIFASPFRITREYVTSVVRETQNLKNEALFPKDDSVVPLPPTMALMGRLQFGFYSVLARLDVEVDFAALEREELWSALE